MSDLIKIDTSVTVRPKEVADVAQITILCDRSGSMGPVWGATLDALKACIENTKGIEGVIYRVGFFDSEDHFEEAKGFYDEDLSVNLDDVFARGGTPLYTSLLKAIHSSEEEAKISPDLKTHHVFIVITDGGDTEGKKDYDKVQKKINKIDCVSSFILLDFSNGQNVGDALGISGIDVEKTPEGIRAAIERVTATIRDISNNILNRIAPNERLSLPPGR